MTVQSLERPSLSQRLRVETADLHERMHQLMARGAPFSSRESYARFVAAQYLFQRDVEHLFDDPAVRVVVPDLAARGRQAASRADLHDLGVEVPGGDLATVGVGMPEALGWLYVSEGSTLGAAFLLKEAEANLGLSAGFGARNLAAYPDGRGVVWKRFVASLDGPEVGVGEHDAVVSGALAAFGRFGGLLERFFG